MPDLIFWRLRSGVVLTSVFGPPALAATALGRDHDSTRPNRAVLRQRVPHGAVGWRERPQDPWRPLSEFPGGADA